MLTPALGLTLLIEWLPSGFGEAAAVPFTHGQTVRALDGGVRPLSYGGRLNQGMVPLGFQPPRANPPERFI